MTSMQEPEYCHDCAHTYVRTLSSVSFQEEGMQQTYERPVVGLSHLKSGAPLSSSLASVWSTILVIVKEVSGS